jgi:hypothetical protein
VGRSDDNFIIRMAFVCCDSRNGSHTANYVKYASGDKYVFVVRSASTHVNLSSLLYNRLDLVQNNEPNQEYAAWNEKLFRTMAYLPHP